MIQLGLTLILLPFPISANFSLVSINVRISSEVLVPPHSAANYWFVPAFKFTMETKDQLFLSLFYVPLI